MLWQSMGNLKKIVTSLSQTKNGRPDDLPLIVEWINGAEGIRTPGLVNASSTQVYYLVLRCPKINNLHAMLSIACYCFLWCLLSSLLSKSMTNTGEKSRFRPLSYEINLVVTS